MQSSAFRSLATLLLILLLLNSIFTIKKDSKNYLTEKESVHSTFFVSGSNPLNNQKDIPLWAKFYSPTIFIGSNSPLNYSYKLQSSDLPLKTVAKETDSNYEFMTRTLAEQNFMRRHFSLLQVLYDNYRPYPIGCKPLKEKKVKRQDRIYFTTSLGVVIPSFPSFQKLNELPSVKSTILKVRGLDTEMPLVSLTRSSGSKGLDQKALDTIKQTLLKTKMRAALLKALQSNHGELQINWRVK